jgi:Mn2+/Fe2+ NRAMP family transporter
MDEKEAKPAWFAPALIATLVVGIILLGKKDEKAVENPVIDLAIITIAVFAFAAVFRKVANMLDHPGLATFFGGPVQPHPDHDTVNTGEAY